MSYIIQGDKVIFENVHGKKDIVLSHNDSGYELVFGSEVKFKVTTHHTIISLGKFDITLASGGDALVFSSDGKTKMILE